MKKNTVKIFWFQLSYINLTRPMRMHEKNQHVYKQLVHIAMPIFYTAGCLLSAGTLCLLPTCHQAHRKQSRVGGGAVVNGVTTVTSLASRTDRP